MALMKRRARLLVVLFVVLPALAYAGFYVWWNVPLPLYGRWDWAVTPESYFETWRSIHFPHYQKLDAHGRVIPGT
jgi:hypothetical protein